jgi:UTP:GlnB (protein PII) uridylyltransferase
VTTLTELQEFLDADRPDAFIDRSQILEGRMIVGTKRFAEAYWRRIVRGRLFTKRLDYVTSMRKELESRHADAVASGLGSTDVKDGIGGLRDILMLLLMYKTAFKIRHPVNTGLLPIIARRDSAHAQEMAYLSGALEFLKNLRSAYRLSVGAEDTLRPEYFGIVASAMDLDYKDEPDAAERLLAEYVECTAKVALVVNTLSAELERSLERGEM